MITIIAGSRSVKDYGLLLSAIESLSWRPTTVVSGCARGVDSLGERWARENNIPLIKCPAQWSTYGIRAGLVRNVAMALKAEALIALWDGKSNGTKHMIDVALDKLQLTVVWRCT